MKHTKKCIGLLLAAALVMQSFLPGAVADAKKVTKPTLSTKTVKVKAGAKKTVNVKNAKGYKITVKSKSKKIATVSKKGKTAFVVKGVKAGETKVICTASKNKKKVTLSCTVKVSKKNKLVEPAASPSSNPAGPVVTSTPASSATQTPAAVQTPTATPEPTVGPFPEMDKFSDVPVEFADAKENVKKGTIEEITYTSKTTYREHKVLEIGRAHV